MRRYLRAAGTMFAASLSACGDGDKIIDGASCYPEASRPWIGAATAQAGAPRDSGGSLTIYLDGSASMVGYIRGATAESRPLADLIGLLQKLDTIESSKLEVVRFDRMFSILKPDEISRMQSEAGYLCPAGNADCDAQESHIDQALAKIAAADDQSLSVVVSDLWLANSEVLTTDGVALAKPLSDIFASGRSVAIYGFESPYRGRVNDLPSGARDVSATRRYLFVVAAGPLARLRALQQAMMTAPSAGIAADLASGKAHYSLFTLEPSIAAAGGSQAFALDRGSPLTKANFLKVRTNVRIPQFALDKVKALRASSPAGASWAGVGSEAILPGAVWEGASQGQTELYRQVGQSCAPKGGDWRAEGKLASGWRDGASFALDPGELATLPTGRYLLVGAVRRTSLASPNPATQWMRDWSFGASNEAEAVQRPVMPTLNLAQTARLLEIALLKSAEARPMNIGGFAVAVDVE